MPTSGTPHGLHLLEAAVEPALLHLELGDAVAQQPAEPVGPFVNDHVVADPGELLGGGDPGPTGADDGDGPFRPRIRWERRHPTLVPGVVDNL
jgi:hypothetical protein